MKTDKQDQMTPGKAIRKVCVGCVGSAHEVRDCGGDKCSNGQSDENGACYFYQHRMGAGRPSVKNIRKFCLECMGGRRQLVSECRCRQIACFMNIVLEKIQEGPG